jgi:predicted protein tyrosine phosphatase
MINAFSRDQMIDYYLSYGILPDEYYISILPTGGPKGVPILPNGHNIITLVFDDVVENSVKDKWPDGIGTFIAQAMTSQQADELCEFIKKIPSDANINVHCVYGQSRSAAIKAAIANQPLIGNPLVYRLVKERLHDNT